MVISEKYTKWRVMIKRRDSSNFVCWKRLKNKNIQYRELDMIKRCDISKYLGTLKNGDKW